MSFWSNWVGGWGASSRFQKHRLLFTNKTDMSPLNESSLKKMMITFSGQDPETRAEIGLAIILRKINDSDSNSSWIYLLKNLIILDSALQQGFFVEQLSDVDMPAIYNFKVVEKNYIQYNLDTLIKKYMKLIKFKANIMNIRVTIFKTPIYRRQEIMEGLNIHEINWHLDQCQQLFNQVFDLSQYKQYNILQFQVVKYLFLMLKNKLITAYSVEMLCISRVLPLLQTMAEPDIQTFKKRILKFNANAGYTIAFFQECKTLKGFQNLNYKEFNFNSKEVISYVDQVLKHIKFKDDVPKHIQTEQLVTDQKLTIVKKINAAFLGKLTPRMAFAQQKIPKKQVFETYFNTYSQDFPPKELIYQEVAQVLKSPNKEDLDSQDEEGLALERSNVLSAYNVQPISRDGKQSKQVGLEYKEIVANKQQFRNIYSNLESTWVS